MLHRKEAARGRGTRWYPQGRGRMRENAVPALFRAKKKTPEHCLLDGVFEKSLAAAYFPT